MGWAYDCVGRMGIEKKNYSGKEKGMDILKK
jgi:hypothetical protein